MKFVKVRSRHPSHNTIRGKIKTEHNVVLRLGSTTPTTVVFPRLKSNSKVIEINVPEAIDNAADKLKMKRRFTAENVLTADWYLLKNGKFYRQVEETELEVKDSDLPYPVIAKHIRGSRNSGNTFINNVEELRKFIVGKTPENYIFERYYNYVKEYRLHVTERGCFYTCRKMIKQETPADERWYRNDSNSVWVLEENEAFDKPNNWGAIVNQCVRALKAVGLDVGAVDLRVQSGKSNTKVSSKDPKFVVIEINSAPSFGDLTAVKYLEEIPKIIQHKLSVE